MIDGSDIAPLLTFVSLLLGVLLGELLDELLGVLFGGNCLAGTQVQSGSVAFSPIHDVGFAAMIDGSDITPLMASVPCVLLIMEGLIFGGAEFC